MRATVKAAKGETPPPELQLAFMCGDDHLPEAGGIMDQDAGTLNRMQGCLSIYKVITKLRNSKGAQIHSLTDGERRLIRRLRDGGYLYE